MLSTALYLLKKETKGFETSSMNIWSQSRSLTWRVSIIYNQWNLSLIIRVEMCKKLQLRMNNRTMKPETSMTKELLLLKLYLTQQKLKRIILTATQKIS